MWKKRIYSGICICGHSWEDHHNGAVLNPEYIKETGEIFSPDACLFFGFDEHEGEDFEGHPHCFNYWDKDDPDGKSSAGEHQQFY